MSVSTKLFKAYFTKANLHKVYTDFIADGASIGRDGVSLEMFAAKLDEEIDLILRKVKARSYQFTSFREKLISKGAGKYPRQLSIPTIRDKLVLKALALLLAEIYPEQVSTVPHTIIKKVHEASKARALGDYYLRLDIQNFYPSIDHKILLRILRKTIKNKQVLHLIENAILTPTGKKKSDDSLNHLGIPQGLSISNILASIYFAEIDGELKSEAAVDYFRFVDDILLIASTERINELEKSLPVTLKKRRKLTCHKVGDGGKSVKVSVGDGIDYLGYRFHLDKIEVRASSLKKMFANLMKIITAIRYKKSGKLIWRLNLRISGCQLNNRRIGWLFFFSQSKNTQQLKQLDAFVGKHAATVLSGPEMSKIKRFVKAYHEIKYHGGSTAYFPNFDSFTDEQKKAQISILLPKKTAAELDALSAKDLNDLFQKCVSHEIADLEKDMMEVFS